MYSATPKQHLKLHSLKKLSSTVAQLKKSISYKKRIIFVSIILDLPTNFQKPCPGLL